MEKELFLSSSMEDYLETIAILLKEKGIARVNDIGRMKKVKNSSVNAALVTLSKLDLVSHVKYGDVKFKSKGEEIAKDIQRRHNVLFKFLNNVLNITHGIASSDACKMEHAISSQTLEKLIKFIEFIEACPDQGRPDWLKGFDDYCKTGKRRKCKARRLRKN